MKRAIALAGAIFFSALPSAGAAEHITVKPNPVHHGERLKVTAHDCESGSDWDARVIVTITKKGKKVWKKRKAAADNGTTRISKRINKDDFPVGGYQVKVVCKHYFHSGGRGTFYKESKSLRVKS